MRIVDSIRVAGVSERVVCPIEQDSIRATKRMSVRPEPETTDDREWQIEKGEEIEKHTSVKCS